MMMMMMNDKSVTSWRGQKSVVSVVSVVSGRLPNSISLQQLVANLATSPSMRGSYGETCQMYFRKWANSTSLIKQVVTGLWAVYDVLH